MRLRYRRRAQSDISEIFDYLAVESPQARRDFEDRLLTTLDLLLQFPFAGSATTRPGVRRLVMPSYRYAVFYRLSGDAIIVLTVRHMARRPPATIG